MTSFSLTGSELKCFLTTVASCSFGPRLFATEYAIVGEWVPIPDCSTTLA
jgi:hypothetical protein